MVTDPTADLTQLVGSSVDPELLTLVGKPRPAEENVPPSRARHARESAGRAAVVLDVNREYLRQGDVVRRWRPDLSAEVVAGWKSLPRAYAETVGDTRRALYLKLDADLDDRLRAWCARNGCSRQDLVRSLLVGWLMDDDSEDAS